MKNLINVLLQKKQRIYEIIALFIQLPEVWNEWLFIVTNRFCLNRLIYTPTRHHCDVIFFSDAMWHSRHFSEVMWHSGCLSCHVCQEQNNIYSDAWKQKTFVLRKIQYLHRCLKTKDPLYHLGNEWRHTFQTFHTFHWVPKLRQNRWFPSTYNSLKM